MKNGADLVLGSEVILSGFVISDADAGWAGSDGGYFCPQMVREALATVNGPATIRLSSMGGDPFAGEAVRSIIAMHDGGVTCIVEGVAGSAASLLYMGAARRIMSAGSLLMIHDPANLAMGNEAAMLKNAALLGKLADTYAAVYAAAAGMTVEKARQIMRDETWFSAQDAFATGFAHSVQEELTTAHAMTMDMARASFAQMTSSMVAMIARKNSGTQDTATDTSAAESGSPAMTAIQKEAVMPDTNPAAPPAATPAVTMVAQPNPDVAVQAERVRAREIRMMAQPFVASMALTSAHVDAEIEAGTSVADAGSRFMALMAASQPAVMRNPTTILRDEVDTRRAGMEQALVAQMSQSAPDNDVARPFMNMSIVEMAAKSVGYTGSLRSAGDRDRFMMSGMHTTSDFTGIFENALNKTLLARYQGLAPTYREIAKKKTFNDFRVHPMVRAGDMPNLTSVGEGGEIKFGTFGEKRETAILTPYATGLRLSRQAIVNDEMGAIADMIADYGTRIVDFEEATFYAFMAAATLASDGLAVWLAAATRGATAAGNLTSSGTAISVASVGIGAAVLRKQTSIDGIKLNNAPSILLVGPDKEVEAAQVATAITPAQATQVNPYAGKLKPVVSAQVTGTNWYLFADPSRLPCFVYGYLNGSEAPRLRTDEPFGVQGWAMTLSHDFGLGAIDFRGTYKNVGA